MENAATNIYNKGKNLGNKLIHLKCYFGVRDDRDMMQTYMLNGIKENRRTSETLAQCIVREMVKEGMDLKSIKSAFDQMNRDVNSAVKSKEIKDLANESPAR